MTDLGLFDQLTPLRSGRIFIRAASGETKPEYPAPSASLPDAAVLVGVVEVPSNLEFERLRPCRINHRLWIDTKRSRPGRSGIVAEGTLVDIIEGHHFAMPALSDACEVFIRRTMLPHKEDHLRWAYVAGALARRPEVLPVDGTYEFDQRGGFRLMDTNLFVGSKPDAVLRACMWGPGGRFGLATSMEPESFHAWSPVERERNRARDPKFADFEERMEARCGPVPMFYTQEELERRDSEAKVALVEALLGKELQ